MTSPVFRRGATEAKRAVKPSEPVHDISGPFEARYPGWCKAPACGDDIHEGDVIQFVDSETWHQDCVIDEQQPGGELS